MAFEDIFTPVTNGQYSVLRHNPTMGSIYGGFEIISGNVYTLKSRILYKSALVWAFTSTIAQHQVKNGIPIRVAKDPTYLWGDIMYYSNQIAVATKRLGGLHIVSNQAVHDFAHTVFGCRIPCKWQIDSDMSDDEVLMAFRGYNYNDGGFPYLDNGDGTCCLFDVHDLDIEYYRVTRVELPASKEVKLNWKR